MDSGLGSTSGLRRRRIKGRIWYVVFAGCAWTGVVLLGILLFRVAGEGLGRLDWAFIEGLPSRFAHKAGIRPALWGTVWLMGLTAALVIPVGVAAAVYLEEYGVKGRFGRFLDLNIANLAGVPSIVYGMLGLLLFVRWMALGRSVLAGALTMSLLILPVVIIASREALRGVPPSIRHAAHALGATKWQTTRAHVLPAALPGILTGVILALSRAIGETAPLLMIGALTYVAFVPEGPHDAFTALPIQIFNWTSRPQVEFHAVAAAGILVLLIVMLLMNVVAVLIRNRAARKLRW